MDPRVRLLFKQLLYMGKEYPVESGGYGKFSRQLKTAFHKTPVVAHEDMEKALARGQFVTSGMYQTDFAGHTNPRIGSTLLSTSIQTLEAKLL